MNELKLNSNLSSRPDIHVNTDCRTGQTVNHVDTFRTGCGRFYPMPIIKNPHIGHCDKVFTGLKEMLRLLQTSLGQLLNLLERLHEGRGSRMLQPEPLLPDQSRSSNIFLLPIRSNYSGLDITELLRMVLDRPSESRSKKSKRKPFSKLKRFAKNAINKVVKKISEQLRDIIFKSLKRITSIFSLQPFENVRNILFEKMSR